MRAFSVFIPNARKNCRWQEMFPNVVIGVFICLFRLFVLFLLETVQTVRGVCACSVRFGTPKKPTVAKIFVKIL